MIPLQRPSTDHKGKEPEGASKSLKGPPKTKLPRSSPDELLYLFKNPPPYPGDDFAIHSKPPISCLPFLDPNHQAGDGLKKKRAQKPTHPNPTQPSNQITISSENPTTTTVNPKPIHEATNNKEETLKPSSPFLSSLIPFTFEIPPKTHRETPAKRKKTSSSCRPAGRQNQIPTAAIGT